ncbi:MAG: conjugal transfer protein TraF [Geminicoccaceae bacterium]
MPGSRHATLRRALALAAALVPVATTAAEAPLGSRFLGRGADGWFWYEALPDPLPPPKKPEPPKVEASPAPVPAAPTAPAGPAPLSTAWFRLELDRFRDRAIDAPTPENVRAYLYLQKVMLDRADSFARVSQQIAAADPYLDAVTERPLSPFAANATSAEATARRGEILQALAASTGLLFVVDSTCSVCVRQADVLVSAQRQYGFALLTVSLDGAAPPGLTLPIRPDRGQAKRLGVVGTPALFLMRPPDVILPLAQGALDLDTLTGRIVDQAHSAGWVDDAAYAATRAVRQPFTVPPPGTLAPAELDDPDRIVATLRARLGLPEALDPNSTALPALPLPSGDLP